MGINMVKKSRYFNIFSRCLWNKLVFNKSIQILCWNVDLCGESNSNSNQFSVNANALSSFRWVGEWASIFDKGDCIAHWGVKKTSSIFTEAFEKQRLKGYFVGFVLSRTSWWIRCRLFLVIFFGSTGWYLVWHLSVWLWKMDGGSCKKKGNWSRW